MPFMVHLKELRNRVLYSVIAIGIGLVIGMIFGQQILMLLKAPAGNIYLVGLKITENITVYFKVSLAAGVIIAMPVLVYQLFAFVAPGLTSKEKKLIFSVLPAIVAMFLLGVAFAYFIALPPALGFLYNFDANVATPLISIDDYVSVVTRLLLLVGLVFETPLIIMALARLGIVSPSGWPAGAGCGLCWLSSFRQC